MAKAESWSTACSKSCLSLAGDETSTTLAVSGSLCARQTGVDGAKSAVNITVIRANVFSVFFIVRIFLFFCFEVIWFLWRR